MAFWRLRFIIVIALLSGAAQATVSRAAPPARPAAGSQPPASVAALWGGARESVILLADGSVWDWGINNCDPGHPPLGTGACGKLGDGSSTERHTPVQVHGPGNAGHLGSITALMGGEHHNFALRSDGTVWAWGANFFGQLGSGNFDNTTLPVQVSGLVSVTALGGRGYHSLAIKSDGTVWAWGWNSSGQLGHDTTGQPCPNNPGKCSDVPVQVVGVSHPLSVTGGGFFSLALMPDHTVMGWGANERGELGNGTYLAAPTAVQASAVLSHVVQLSAGWKHALALTDDGHVWAWGDNFYGEIGTGVTSTLGISVPVQVPGLDHVIVVSGGDRFSGALKDNGSVWTWGWNGFGQLGNATFNDSASPVQVHNLGHAKQYAARDYHDLAVLDDGTVWDWGSNENGELGNNTIGDSDVPVEVIFAAAPEWDVWLPFLAHPSN